MSAASGAYGALAQLLLDRLAYPMDPYIGRIITGLHAVLERAGHVKYSMWLALCVGAAPN